MWKQQLSGLTVDAMPRILVATGNDQFTGDLVRSLAGHDVELVAAVKDACDFGDADVETVRTLSGSDPSHVLLAVRPGRDKAAAVHEVLDALDGTPPVIFLANSLDGEHGEAVEAVKESGRPWTIIYPNAMMEYAFAAFAPQILMGCAFGMSGRGRVGFVALDDVTSVIARVVHEEGHEGQEYVCTGPEASDMPTVLATLSDVIGRHIDYIDLPEKEIADLMMQHAGFASRDDLENMVLGHLRTWRSGDADVVTGVVDDLTGQSPMSVRDWFELHRSQFNAKPSLMQKAANKMIKARYGGRILR